MEFIYPRRSEQYHRILSYDTNVRLVFDFTNGKSRGHKTVVRSFDYSEKPKNCYRKILRRCFTVTYLRVEQFNPVTLFLEPDTRKQERSRAKIIVVIF